MNIICFLLVIVIIFLGITIGILLQDREKSTRETMCQRFEPNEIMQNKEQIYITFPAQENIEILYAQLFYREISSPQQKPHIRSKF